MPLHRIRLLGEKAVGGRIEVPALLALLGSLQRASRALLREASGLASTTASPRWLLQATTLELVGLRGASTVLDLEAPSLHSIPTADLPGRPGLPADWTCLDWLASTIEGGREDADSGRRLRLVQHHLRPLERIFSRGIATVEIGGRHMLAIHSGMLDPGPGSPRAAPESVR